MSRKARPAKAGLKRLQPKPPKVILTMPMAKSAPTTIIHGWMLLGMLNARRMPVRMAEPSVTVVLGFFSMNLLIAHSKNTHEATEMAVVMIAPTPKLMNEHRRAGTRAMQTQYMFFCTESPLCTWGESDTTNLFAIILFTILPFTIYNLFFSFTILYQACTPHGKIVHCKLSNGT